MESWRVGSCGRATMGMEWVVNDANEDEVEDMLGKM